jgi:RNA polymerase sigma-70 factor, ECF subfamily
MVRNAPYPPLSSAEDLRLRELIRAHFDFVWRTLQRVGVVDADLQDAAQQVFSVVAGKLSQIGVGVEKSFIFGTSLRVASHARRARRQRREAPLAEAEGLSDIALDPEAALQRNQALQTLAEILETMDEPTRAVFVLFELEQLTMAEIADWLKVPPGTVASRLRRARERFHAGVAQRSDPEGAA